jgi:hypothetical protein
MVAAVKVPRSAAVAQVLMVLLLLHIMLLLLLLVMVMCCCCCCVVMVAIAAIQRRIPAITCCCGGSSIITIRTHRLLLLLHAAVQIQFAATACIARSSSCCSRATCAACARGSRQLLRQTAASKVVLVLMLPLVATAIKTAPDLYSQLRRCCEIFLASHFVILRCQRSMLLLAWELCAERRYGRQVGQAMPGADAPSGIPTQACAAVGHVEKHPDAAPWACAVAGVKAGGLSAAPCSSGSAVAPRRRWLIDLFPIVLVSLLLHALSLAVCCCCCRCGHCCCACAGAALGGGGHHVEVLSDGEVGAGCRKMGTAWQRRVGKRVAIRSVQCRTGQVERLLRERQATVHPASSDFLCWGKSTS